MKATTKAIARFLSHSAVYPSVLAYRLHAAFAGADNAFPGWSQLFSLVPGVFGQFLRHAFYRCTARQCGADTCIGFGTIASHSGVSFGRTVYVGNYCSLGDVVLEDDVLVASHVSIMNGCRQHGTDRLDIPIREQPGVFEPVTIGEGSWIGERAIVAANVGRQCIIGAGSLVIEPVPDFAIAVGSPARVIGDRRNAAAAEKTSSRNCEINAPADQSP